MPWTSLPCGDRSAVFGVVCSPGWPRRHPLSRTTSFEPCAGRGRASSDSRKGLWVSGHGTRSRAERRGRRRCIRSLGRRDGGNRSSENNRGRNDGCTRHGGRTSGPGGYRPCQQRRCVSCHSRWTRGIGARTNRDRAEVMARVMRRYDDDLPKHVLFREAAGYAPDARWSGPGRSWMSSRGACWR